MTACSGLSEGIAGRRISEGGESQLEEPPPSESQLSEPRAEARAESISDRPGAASSSQQSFPQRSRASSLSVAAVSSSGGIRPAVTVPGEGGKAHGIRIDLPRFMAAVRETVANLSATYTWTERAVGGLERTVVRALGR